MDMTTIESTPWRARDLPPVTVETLTAALHAKESELTAAREARHAADRDVRRANAANDRRELPQLNKVAGQAGRLVSSLEQQLGFASVWKWPSGKLLPMRRPQRRRALAIGCLRYRPPDGRRVRHRAGAREALQRRLEPGYRVVDEVVGYDADGNGGIYAASLRQWLADNNYGQPVVILPGNGREEV